jgi:hypothetical protein
LSSDTSIASLDKVDGSVILSVKISFVEIDLLAYRNGTAAVDYISSAFEFGIDTINLTRDNRFSEYLTTALRLVHSAGVGLCCYDRVRSTGVKSDS